MPQNPFMITPGGDMTKGLSGLSGMFQQIGQQNREEEIRTRAADKFAAMKAGALEAFKSGDPDRVSQFMVSNPEMAQAMKQASAFKSEATEKNYVNSILGILRQPEMAGEIAGQRQEFLKGEGLTPDQTKDTDGFAEIVSGGGEIPEETRKKLEMDLAVLAPDKWKAYKEIYKPEGAGLPTSAEEFSYYRTLLRDNPGEAKKYATQVGITPKPSDDRTGAIKEFEYGEKNPKFKIEQKRKEDLNKTKEVEKSTFEDSSKLRKEFLSQSSEFQKVRDAYTRVVGSTKDPSPAGDLSLIFNYMKMLDPGSVVRESEFATAAAAGSYGERIKASVEKVISGERLSPKMRTDFVKKSGTLMGGMQKQHNKREANYTSIAEKNNLPVNEVVVDITAPEEPGPDNVVKTDAPQTAIDYLKANPDFKGYFQEKYGYLPEGI